MSGYSWAELDSLCRDPITGQEKSFEEAEKIKQMLIERDKNKNVTICKKKKKKKKKQKKKSKKDSDDELLDAAIKENEKIKKENEFKKYVKDNSEISNWIYSGVLRGSDPVTTEKLIRSTFDSKVCIQSLTSLRDFERTLSKEKNMIFWKQVSNAVYAQYNTGVTVDPLPGVDKNDEFYKVRFYESILVTYIKDIFLSCIVDLMNKKIFEKFDRQKEPLLMLTAQKDLKDIFPVIDVILPANKMMQAGLIPKDFMTFNPFGEDRKFLCCCLFYSFSLSYNLFFSFFSNEENEFVFYSTIFDRSEIIPDFVGQIVNIRKDTSEIIVDKAKVFEKLANEQ